MISHNYFYHRASIKSEHMDGSSRVIYRAWCKRRHVFPNARIFHHLSNQMAKTRSHEIHTSCLSTVWLYFNITICIECYSSIAITAHTRITYFLENRAEENTEFNTGVIFLHRIWNNKIEVRASFLVFSCRIFNRQVKKCI